jgi:phage-related protein
VAVLAAFAGTIFIIEKAMKAWAVIQKVLDVELLANPIGLVVVAVAALAIGLIYAYKHSETFRRIVNGALSGIADAAKAMWNVIRPILKLWADEWLFVVGTLLHGAAAAFGWVPGIGPKLKGAAKEFDKFAKAVNGSLDGITSDKTITIHALTAAQTAQGVRAIQTEQAGQGVSQRAHRGSTTHVTNLVVDGKQMAQVVTHHQTGLVQRGHMVPGAA